MFGVKHDGEDAGRMSAIPDSTCPPMPLRISIQSAEAVQRLRSIGRRFRGAQIKREDPLLVVADSSLGWAALACKAPALVC